MYSVVCPEGLTYACRILILIIGWGVCGGVGAGFRDFKKEAYLVYWRELYNEIREVLPVSSCSLHSHDGQAEEGGMVNQRYNRIIDRTQ